MREGPPSRVVLSSDVAQLCAASITAGRPRSPEACWWRCRVQEVQLAAHADPSPPGDQAAVSGELRQEAVAVEVRAVGCCGWGVDWHRCEGCPGVGEVQAAPLWAALLYL